jgi:hypothetical protein
MTVSELIEILQTIESPEKARIMVQDTAGGFRDIDYVEDSLDIGKTFIIHTMKQQKK